MDYFKISVCKRLVKDDVMVILFITNFFSRLLENERNFRSLRHSGRKVMVELTGSSSVEANVALG